MSESLNLTLKIWRQPNADSRGEFKNYQLHDVSTHMSFLEMLDVLNEQLINQGEEPVASPGARPHYVGQLRYVA